MVSKISSVLNSNTMKATCCVMLVSLFATQLLLMAMPAAAVPTAAVPTVAADGNLNPATTPAASVPNPQESNQHPDVSCSKCWRYCWKVECWGICGC
ncbi:hypothetical protein ACP70R_019777 [Stipagrostis hirtigluma subsp. patula]